MKRLHTQEEGWLSMKSETQVTGLLIVTVLLNHLLLMYQLQTSKRKYMSTENGSFTKRNTFPGATIHILWYWNVSSHLGEGRSKEVKRFVCLFTSLSSRAIHIESTNSLSTSYKHFDDVYHEEVMNDTTELIMTQILLWQVKNWTRHFQRWTTRK